MGRIRFAGGVSGGLVWAPIRSGLLAGAAAGVPEDTKASSRFHLYTMSALGSFVISYILKLKIFFN